MLQLCLPKRRSLPLMLDATGMRYQSQGANLNAMRLLLLMGCRLHPWARWRARSAVRMSCGWPLPSPMQLCR